MRVWPDSEEHLASGKNELNLKLEAWLLGIPIMLGIAAAIWSLF